MHARTSAGGVAGMGTPKKGSIAFITSMVMVFSHWLLVSRTRFETLGCIESIRSGGKRQTSMDWNDDALAALKEDVPFFVRPAVRRRVESMAADENRPSIDLSFYQQAKASMGPK